MLPEDFERRFRVPRARRRALWLRAGRKVALGFVALVVASLVSTAWRAARSSPPRVWAAGDVPVAFWAWRTEAPGEDEILRAREATGARVLFLRAGQFEYERGGRVRRIRPVAGRIPRAPELQLVYNAERRLLAEFERVGESALAATVVETYSEDGARALRDGAQVSGLQLDFDVPTRLLSRYARVLRAVRERLPAGAKLSVTGLPTWMNSTEISSVLDEVDFWIPQCYGAEIPSRLDARVPIASPIEVARTVRRARLLGKPFYAGLAAYGDALVYDSEQKLVSLRGDLDPSLVARDANFELIERVPFEREARATDASVETSATVESEWRYVYRVRGEGMIDGLSLRAGDYLLLDMPSGASLRACVRGVREQAGERLLGICLFRLPGRADSTALKLEQMAAALADRDTSPQTGISVRRAGAGQPDDAQDDVEARARSNQLSLRATNTGATAALAGDDALTLDLKLERAGSLRGILRVDGFASVEPLCESSGEGAGRAQGDGSSKPSAGETAKGSRDESAKSWEGVSLRRCGLGRASVLRLKAPAWGVGESAAVSLSFEGEPPPTLSVGLVVRADDGRIHEERREVRVENGEGR